MYSVHEGLLYVRHLARPWGYNTLQVPVFVFKRLTAHRERARRKQRRKSVCYRIVLYFIEDAFEAHRAESSCKTSRRLYHPSCDLQEKRGLNKWSRERVLYAWETVRVKLRSKNKKDNVWCIVGGQVGSTTRIFIQGIIWLEIRWNLVRREKWEPIKSL